VEHLDVPACGRPVHLQRLSHMSTLGLRLGDPGAVLAFRAPCVLCNIQTAPDEARSAGLQLARATAAERRRISRNPAPHLTCSRNLEFVGWGAVQDDDA
jgi:hypothetical protein